MQGKPMIICRSIEGYPPLVQNLQTETSASALSKIPTFNSAFPSTLHNICFSPLDFPTTKISNFSRGRFSTKPLEIFDWAVVRLGSPSGNGVS